MTAKRKYVTQGNVSKTFRKVEKQRPCMNCGKNFGSTDSSHRHCDKCRSLMWQKEKEMGRRGLLYTTRPRGHGFTNPDPFKPRFNNGD